MVESEFEFPRYDLTGKKAVVTGASQGIDSWIALGLARAGAHVAVNYNSSRRQAEEVCGRITDMGYGPYSWPPPA